MSNLERTIADVIDLHKYEVHCVCACGKDLDPEQVMWGKYKKVWRAHLAAEIAAVVAYRSVPL